MEWYQVATIIISNLSIFLWATRQSRTDFLHLDRKLEENRKETQQIVKEIQEEVKDFHARLYVIEERNKR